MITRIEFQLAIATRKDEQTGVYVGFSPLLKIYSQGNTDQQAEDAAVSAATLFISSCYEKNILHNVLRERGLKRVATKSERPVGSAQYISVSGFDRAIERSIPLELLSPVGEEALCQ